MESLVTRKTRREFLWNTGSGLGVLAFSSLLGESRAASAIDPLAPKTPHFAPKVKSVIWVFMEGGPSHVDLFDPKPELEKLAGQPLPASFGKPMTAMGTGGRRSGRGSPTGWARRIAICRLS